ncbi:TniB family NTP-binding protein [Pseudomonas sp. Pseu.R1]|uniref:TniB family NTP-binding protein n=1 Tax=Pseudomonas sp. Pseu.R1 TaxID=3379818 RepID=UPI003B9348E8
MSNAKALKLIKVFQQQTIFFPAFAQAYSTACDVIDMAIATGAVTSAIICGRSGTGKTTLSEQLQKHYALESEEIITPEGVIYTKRTVYFEVPPPPTIKQLVETMLTGLGVNNPRGSTSRLTTVLVNRLKLMKVEVVFLDEIQRLCKPEARKVRIATLEWLVDLANKLNKPIILIGTEGCRDITSYYESFANRFPYMIELTLMEYEANPTSVFQLFMKTLDEVIHRLKPMKSSVHLHDAEISAAIYVATRGNLKQINIILQDVLLQCFQRPDELGMTTEDFLCACDPLKLHLNLCKSNPFELTLEQCRMLINSVEKIPFPTE